MSHQRNFSLSLIQMITAIIIMIIIASQYQIILYVKQTVKSVKSFGLVIAKTRILPVSFESAETILQGF